ncbi:MAG TPA: DUF433 domain-containing protein [Gemmataceae bacterium]|jgi:uncharacterized protein (DUF433 family)
MGHAAPHQEGPATAPTVVDRGSGPQLSTCKITVQDLLPFFKAGKADAEILAWYPQLGPDEVRLLRGYYLDHTAEVLAAEAEIAAYHDELRRKYHRPSPLDHLPPDDRRAYLLREAERLASEADGVHDPAR